MLLTLQIQPIGGFTVSRFNDVHRNDEMMESLMFEDSRKKFTRSLVRHHGIKKSDSSFDDFVRVKGKSLVELLAGACRSCSWNRTSAPLYDYFGRAGRKAVVLLDEANVFMAKHNDQNLTTRSHPSSSGFWSTTKAFCYSQPIV